MSESSPYVFHQFSVAVNGEKVSGERSLVTRDLLHGKTILLKRGKKHWHASHWNG